MEEFNIPIKIDVTTTFDTKKLLTAMAGIAGAIFVGSFASGYVVSKMLKGGK